MLGFEEFWVVLAFLSILWGGHPGRDVKGTLEM